MPEAILSNALLAALWFTSTSAWLFSKRQIHILQAVQKQAFGDAFKILDGTLSDDLTSGPSTCNKNTVAVRKE
jgi:tyrosinase